MTAVRSSGLILDHAPISSIERQTASTQAAFWMHDTDLDAGAFDFCPFPDFVTHRLVFLCCAQYAQPIQNALQDIARSDMIDHFCATFAGRIRL